MITPVVLALGLMVNISSGSAQTSGPQITAVTVVSTDSNSATIAYTFSESATAQVFFDTSAHAKVSDYASFTATNAPATSGQVLVAGLKEQTTYHFRLEAKSANGTTDSADRTFTTSSASSTGSSGGGILITNIRPDCIDTRCQVTFSTNISGTVQIAWDLNFHDTFGAYPNSAGESSPSNGQRALLMTGLTKSTTYHYRLLAVGGGSQFMTNDLTLATSASSSDHIFSTGACPDGTAINSCNANREYCATGGFLEKKCNSICGYVCSTGQTCNVSGACIVDPLLNGSPYQCNQASCYTAGGQLNNPAPAGCYSSWPKCNANTILKVQKDRGCNLWLTCATSLQTEPTSSAPAENLCLSLAACNSLGLEGQCNKYLPQGQCTNDPLRFCSTDLDCAAGGTCATSPADQPTRSLQDLTFKTPEDVGQIADLSGNVIAGLDWHQQGGTNIIQGALPWQLMRQIGGNAQQLKNGDFEYDPPATTGWHVAPLIGSTGNATINVVFEDRDNSINHVLAVNPVTSDAGSLHCAITTDPTTKAKKACTAANAATICTATGDTCVPDVIKFSGAVTDPFTASPSEYYYAEARIKATSGNPVIRFQFGFNDYTSFAVGTTPTSVDVKVTNAWQRVTLGPIRGMSGLTRLAAVCATNDPNDCPTGGFLLDDVQVRPVLQTTTNPTYITPSCRLYPKDDSPSCDYVDQNNVVYKGWHGYCLEHDSQTGTCLSWWPVDIIKGETNVFGVDTPAGYQNRAPLYLCASAVGNDKGKVQSTAPPYDIQDNSQFFDNVAGTNCSLATHTNPFTFGTCDTAYQRTSSFSVSPTMPNYHLSESEIAKLDLVLTNVSNRADQWVGTYSIINDADFQRSSAASPRFASIDDGNNYHYIIYREVQPDGRIFWRIVDNSGCPANSNINCLQVNFVFNRFGQFEGYEYSSNDQTDSTGINEADYLANFYSREVCSTIVQVVDPLGNNQAFASRVNSPSYAVPALNLTQSADLSPFGGVAAPNGFDLTNPTTWPAILPIETPDTQNFDPPGQARGGTPYSCDGPCTDIVCSTTGESCLTAGQLDPSQVNKCQTNTTAPGECTGVKNSGQTSKGPQSFGSHPATDVTGNPFFAQGQIERLFTASFGIWQYSFTLGKYVRVDNVTGSGQVNWTPPTAICPNDATTGQPARPAYPNDFCAIPPKVFGAAFLNSTATSANISSGSGTIGLKFNTSADADQVPLNTISVDWGDSIDTFSYPFAPRNDPAKPHVFSHAYVLNRGTNAKGCGVNASKQYVCTYRIKVQVKDNWGWCNDKAGGNNLCPVDSTNWYDTGLVVTVTP